MVQNEKDIPITLPAELRRQFDELEHRLWRVESTIALCHVGGGLIISFLTLFVSERLWDTPVWLRTALLAAGLGSCVGAGWLWARNWLPGRRRDLRALAVLVQKNYWRMGDRLLGIVELANEHRHLPNFSPALYHAAITQVAEDARGCDFKTSVDTRPAKRLVGVGAAMAALVLVIIVCLPQAAGNAFARWIAPTSATERYTLVRLRGLPATLVVPHGERFEVTAQVDYRAFWRPSQATARFSRQPSVNGTVQLGEMRIAMPPQTEEGVLMIKVGDASERVQIQPCYRPSLKDLDASIQLPDYLHYPIQTQTVRNGSMMITEGSRVSFRAKISRAISMARMRDETNATVPLKVEDGEFSSEPVPVNGMAQYSMIWRDELGLSNAAPLRLVVQTQKDAPPTVDVPDLPRDAILLATDVLPLRVQTRDDFGVRDLGLVWEAFSDIPRSDGTAVTEVKVQTASSQEQRAEKTFQWSPSIYRIPADSMVEIQAYARDCLPGRERVKSALYRIQVLSPEKHAEMLRQRLESTMEHVEEITRLEEKILNNTSEITNNPSLTEAQKNARLSQAKEDQSKNTANLDQLAREVMNLMQEAMKNPMVSEEAVRQFSQTAQQWQKLAQGKMKQAAQSLESARKNSQSKQQDLADAIKKEKEVLDELAKQQDKNNENMDQLQATTFSQRLQRLGTQEIEASEQLLNAAPDTIGLMPAEVPPKFKEFQTGIATGQESVQKESESLAHEISRFVERTFKTNALSNVRSPVPKTNYVAVCKEMKEAQIPDELDSLKDMVRGNVMLESSTVLTNWSRRFHDWGAKLEPKSDDGGSGKGAQGKNGEKQINLAKQLVALLRLREKEMTLREQTGVLDEQKGETYKDQATQLSADQKKLAETLDSIHQDTQLDQLDSSFTESADAMNQAAALLQKPQTDKVTDHAEVAAIESLSDLINMINEQSQRPNPQQSEQQQASAEEMAFLTQMMKEASENKKGPVNSGSRALNGGTTVRASAPTSGNAQGRAAAQRAVNKATGVLDNSPAEFREALENYYHAIEGK